MRRRRERGFALVLVLWGVGLLAVMAATLARETAVETRTAANLIELAKAEAAADAGARLAMLALARKDDGKIRCGIEGALVSVEVEDEGGKVDLNAASPALLRALFEGSGLGEDEAGRVVDGIVQFRIKEGVQEPRFEDVSELEQMTGIGEDREGVSAYRRVARHVTVHSGRAGIDREAADPALLELLGQSGSEFVQRSSRRHFRLRAVAEMPSGIRFLREAIVDTRPGGGRPFAVRRWWAGEAEAGSPRTAAPDCF